MRRRGIWLLVSTMVMSLALFGCGVDSSNQGSPNDGFSEVVVAIPTDPEGLDPHKTESAAAGEIEFNIYEGLLKPDTDGKLIGAVAQDHWDISPDGTKYTFYLRDNIHFHNGRKVTVEDVIFSFNRIMDPDTGHPRAKEYQIVERVEALGGNAIRFSLSESYAPFLANLAAISGAIVPQEAVDGLMTEPVGTGPFKFSSWEPGQSIVLERFEEYRIPERPILDRVVFRIISDDATAMMNLQTGDIDIYPRIPNESAAEVEANDKLKLVVAPQNLVQLMVINNIREPFNDLRIRQALLHAVDKQEIIEGAMWGYGVALGSNMSPVMGYWYKDLNDMYPYDPDKARDLLAEAGYPDGFTTTLALPAPYTPHIRTGEIIKAQLEKVDIEVQLQIVEWATWLEAIYAGRDYDMTVIGFTGKLDPHTVLYRYESDYGRNFFNFTNAEYDQLISEGTRVTDPEERQEIYYRCQEILAEEAAAVYIQDPHLLIGMGKGVQGWQVYPIYVMDMSTVYVER